MVQAERLKEARVYVGFGVEEVAGALAIGAEELEAMESGGAAPTSDQIERLSRIYRRPISFFEGAPPPDLSPEVERMLDDNPELSPGDRSELADFARFLAELPKP